ncbi:MAG: ParA family partition ATPase [Alphaproteobacteria bacterium]|nr:ParA family partition ATPase [Alphaproteobacteria bacterium]
MATTITIAQQKGGAGKTTLALHLAVAWSRTLRVAAVDIDPQGSLIRWDKLREGRPWPRIMALGGWRIAAEVERLARDHDVVLIDSPPHAETEAKLAVRAASLVVVPLQPSIMDLWATEATLQLAKEERRPAVIVLNRVPPRSRAAELVVERAAEFGVPILQHRVGNRAPLQASLLSGQGITEYAPSSPAAQEISAVADALLTHARRP